MTTRHDLCKEVSTRLGIPQTKTKATLEGFLETVTKILAQGNRLELRRFGTLSPHTLEPKEGVRNPRTGEPCPGLPRRTIVRFRPARDLRRWFHPKTPTEANRPC